MAELRIEGADQLKALAKKLREADKPTRAALVKSLRPEVKKITSEVQQTVRTAPSKGRKGLGHSRRAAHTLSRTKRITSERAYTAAARKAKGPASEAQIEHVKSTRRAKQSAKAAAGAGLRESIANATTGSISTGSASTGVSVSWRVRASKMANSQRRLPRGFNSPKGWRHPVFGDRENWVTQYGTPYFDVVIKRHDEFLRDRVIDGMQRAAESILHPESATP